MPGKHVPQRKLTGQLGINLIERIVLKIGYAWHPCNAELDAGIDGIIELRDPASGQATNCIIQVQSKSLGGRFTGETDVRFEYLCDQRDIDYWLAGNAPVILVVSRRDTDEAYWVSLKEYFKDIERRKSRRVVFDKRADRFDESCAEAFRRLAAPRLQGLYTAPLPKEETLISNLFPIVRLPTVIYVASATVHTAGQIWSHARSQGVTLTGEWLLKSKQVTSFHNLREHPWRDVCDMGTVEAFDVDEWALSDDLDRQNDFRQLLHRCLESMLSRLDIVYSDYFDIFLFRATRDLTPRRFPYESLKQATARSVFRPYQSKTTPGRTAYYRHSAFEGSFRRFAGQWFLQVTPTYYFSSDGYRVSKYAPERLQGIKRLERNSAVLGQLVMWIECLTRGATLFEAEYPYLAFGKPERFTVPVGINDSVWLPHEEETESDTLQNDLQDARLFEL